MTADETGAQGARDARGLVERAGPVEAALRQQPFDLSTAQWRHWRVGRKVGRTIYAQLAEHASDDDVLIGVMDTEALAHDAVNCHNTTLRAIDVA